MSDELIHFRCSYCTSEISAKNSDVGKKVFCRSCYKEMVVPVQSSKPVTDVDSVHLYGVDELPVDIRESLHRYHFYKHSCPVCYSILTVRQEELGREMVCPDCETKVLIPLTALKQDLSSLFDSPAKSDSSSAKEVYGISTAGLAYPLLDGDGKAIETSNESFLPNPDEFSVYCPLCETLQYVTEKMVGQTTICPECERSFVIRRRQTPVVKSEHSPVVYEGRSIYGVTEPVVPMTPQDHPSKGTQEALLEVVCKLCSTQMYVPIAMVGQQKECPDCGTLTEIKAKSEDRKMKETLIEPVFTGGYAIGEAAIPKYGRGTKEDVYTTKKSDISPHVAAKLAASAIPPQLPMSGSGKASPPGSVPPVITPVSASPPSLEPPSKQSATSDSYSDQSAPVKVKKKKKAKPQEVLSGGVTAKRVGDRVVLVAPRPPQWPMLNHVFRPGLDLNLLRHIVIATMCNAVGLALWVLVVVPMFAQMSGGIGGAGPGMIVVPCIALIAFMGACAIRQTSLYFLSVFASTSYSGGPISEWLEEDFVSGVIQGVWLLGVMAVASIPSGILLALLSGQSPFILPAAIAMFLFFFPIVFFIAIQSEGSSLAVIGSLFTCGLSWFLFYIQTALIAGLPCWFWFSQQDEIRYVVAGIIVLAIIPSLYALLIGRLAWIVADYFKNNG